jgi:hypothetical protein
MPQLDLLISNLGNPTSTQLNKYIVKVVISLITIKS